LPIFNVLTYFIFSNAFYIGVIRLFFIIFMPYNFLQLGSFNERSVYCRVMQTFRCVCVCVCVISCR